MIVFDSQYGNQITIWINFGKKNPKFIQVYQTHRQGLLDPLK